MAEADYRFITDATGQRIAAALEALVNLGDPVTIAHGGTGASTAAGALAALGAFAAANVYNGLDQTAAGYALDARQGKALSDAISNKMIHVENTISQIITNASGYADIHSYIPTGHGSCQLACIVDWGSISPMSALTIMANGYYIFGMQNQTITDLKVWYYFDS